MQDFLELIVAMGGFTAVHFGMSWAPVRGPMAAKLGERWFSHVYSLVSLVFFGWAIFAFVQAPFVELWPMSEFARWAAILLMPLAAVLSVGGYFTPNPLSIIGHKHMRNRPRGILTITRHPIMWAFAIWAFVHMGANGDVASLIFYGLFALVALGGARHVDFKKKVRYGERYEDIAKATSFVPFVAVLQGRTKLDLAGFGLKWIALSAALYAGLLLGHGWVLGVSPLP